MSQLIVSHLLDIVSGKCMAANKREEEQAKMLWSCYNVLDEFRRMGLIFIRDPVKGLYEINDDWPAPPWQLSMNMAMRRSVERIRRRCI